VQPGARSDLASGRAEAVVLRLIAEASAPETCIVALIEVAGTTLFHQGRANLIDDQVPTSGVDIFLAGIAGRSFTEDYWARIDDAHPTLAGAVVAVINRWADSWRAYGAERAVRPGAVGERGTRGLRRLL
jgi:hypothetical protein